jgi:HK97 family phage prohead protease
MTIERKICRLSLEVKAVEGRVIKGYATTYDGPDEYDSYGDIVAPGAFNASVAGVKKLPMLNSHGAPIGTWDIFKDDPGGSLGGHPGLWVEGTVSKVSEGDDVLTLIDDESITGLSVGFELLRSETLDGHMTRWGYPVRQIIEGTLMEISPTAMPANRNARISEIRSRRAAEWQATTQEAAPATDWTRFEQLLERFIGEAKSLR